MITDEIGGFLAANGIGTLGGINAPDGTIWGGWLPDTPSDVIVIQTYGGAGIEIHHDSRGVEIERPRVQIRVRAKDYDDGYDTIESIFRLMGNLGNIYIGGTFYRRILATQSPFPMERDENQRFHFVCNFQVEKGLSADV